MYDFFDGHIAPQDVDVDDPANLLHVVALVLGMGKVTALDPVLNGVGFQTRDAGYLT